MIFGLLALLSLWAPSARGAEPGQAEDAAVQHALDQAKLFTRRGRERGLVVGPRRGPAHGL